MYSSSTSPGEIAAMQGWPVPVRKARRRVRTPVKKDVEPLIQKGGLRIPVKTLSNSVVFDYAANSLLPSNPPKAIAQSRPLPIEDEKKAHEIVPLMQYLRDRGVSTYVEPPIEISGPKIQIESPKAKLKQVNAVEPENWSDAVLKMNKADEMIHDLNLFSKSLGTQLKDIQITLQKMQAHDQVQKAALSNLVVRVSKIEKAQQEQAEQVLLHNFFENEDRKNNPDAIQEFYEDDETEIGDEGEDEGDYVEEEQDEDKEEETEGDEGEDEDQLENMPVLVRSSTLP